jgi:hypothetical protein
MHVWIGALDTALHPHGADYIEAQRRKLRHAFSNDLDLVVCCLCFEFAASSIFASICRPGSLFPLNVNFILSQTNHSSKPLHLNQAISWQLRLKGFRADTTCV